MEPLPDLPPKVPEELAALDRVLQLLGAVCQAGSIKHKHHAELEALLGCKVTQQLASHWKTHLKEIRRDVAAELATRETRPDCPAAGGALIRRMPREEIRDGLLDEASDVIEALDSLTFGLREELGVPAEHAIFQELTKARSTVDRVTWMLDTIAIRGGEDMEAPAEEGRLNPRAHAR